MAVTVGSKVIKMTATLDVFDSQQKRLIIRAVRLVSDTAKSTAKLRINDANGEIIYSLSALADASDEAVIDVPVDGGKIHLTLTGTAPEVFIYLG